MDIKKIDQTPYFLDIFTKHTVENPNDKMDKVEYHYGNVCNILTIYKQI